MRHLEAVIASTNVDFYNERLSRERLDTLVEAISNSYIPIGIEHDPRIPPQGRMSSAHIRERPDREFEAVAILEFFEEGDPPSLNGDKREIVVRKHLAPGLTISHAWTHRGEQDQADIAAIATIFGTKPIYEVKKAADPISLITIAGAFALGGIASGFLKEMGSDGWKLVKRKLSSLTAKSESRKGEQILSFAILTGLGEGAEVAVEVLLTDPSPEDIDWVIESGLQIVESVLPIYLENSPEIRRLVFEARNEKVELQFAVRSDCRPLKPTLSVQQILLHRDDS
ncbi:MAG TPA: hypothetical protein VMI10_10395 [Terriglobales bacterium]|nr:hypothetical protein [Terriglobales bacterium]HTT21688.1 hypothetical protein [Candidatus Sulfotelmatobacter sp.]